MNRQTLPAVSLLALGALSVLGVIVLAALGQPVPDLLPSLALSCLSALAGLALPSVLGAGANAGPPAPPAGPDAYPDTPAAAATPDAPVYLIATQSPATDAVNPGQHRSSAA